MGEWAGTSGRLVPGGWRTLREGVDNKLEEEKSLLTSSKGDYTMIDNELKFIHDNAS